MQKESPKLDIGRGWAWLVLLASYGIILVLTLTMYMSGVLYVSFLDNYNEGPAKTSIIGSLNTGLYAVIGPFASVLINTFSCRTSILLGGLLCSVCFFVAFFLDSIDTFIVVLGFLDGLGICLAFVPATVVLAYNFVERRRLVISLASVVPGFGMFAASPLCLFLLEKYGLKGTLLIISGIQMHMVIFGIICRPSSLEKEVKMNNKKRKAVSNQQSQKRTSNRSAVLLKLKRVLNVDLLLISSFFSFLFSVLSWGFVYSLCLVHLPNYVVKTASVDANITGVMSVFSICTIIGRIITAFLVENGRIHLIVLHSGMCAVLGCVNILLPFYGGLPHAVYVYSGIAGTFLGGLNAILCPITLLIVGVDRFSTGHGMAYFFSGIGQITGPYLGGILFGLTGTYDSTFIIGGIVVLCGCIFGIVSTVKLKSADKNRQNKSEEYIEVSEKPNDIDSRTLDLQENYIDCDEVADTNGALCNFKTDDTKTETKVGDCIGDSDIYHNSFSVEANSIDVQENLLKRK